jgi:hypothetical protein
LGQTPFELLGLTDLDTRHKHESESEWCQAHHVAEASISEATQVIDDKKIQFARQHGEHLQNCTGEPFYETAKAEIPNKLLRS